MHNRVEVLGLVAITVGYKSGAHFRFHPFVRQKWLKVSKPESSPFSEMKCEGTAGLQR